MSSSYCTTMSQDEMQVMSEQFCKQYGGKPYILSHGNIRYSILFRDCKIYLKNTSIKEDKKQDDVILFSILVFGIVFTITLMVILVYRRYKKKKGNISSKYKLNSMNDMQMSLIGPKSSKISVMFIHRFIHPFLITETDKQSIHTKNKLYDFTVNMFSGLAFQQHQSLHYIPIYLKDFKQMISEVPLFLVADQNKGYKIPQQISSLLQFVKGVPMKEITKKDGINFLTDRIKKECLRYLKGKHDKCCKERCCQGMLSEDSSELWSASSLYTSKSQHVYVNAPFEFENNQLPPDLTLMHQNIEQWQNEALELDEESEIFTT